jgi:phosphate transport system substrate-binding protein
MKTVNLIVSILIFVMILGAGCNRSGIKEHNDTPTTGEITIGTDETFEPITQAEINVFEGIYSFSKIDLKKGSENEMFKALFDDSVRLIVASRKLSNEEMEFFKSKKIFPRQTLLAVDAVALIVNVNNKDSLFSIVQLKDILTGKIGKWSDLNKSNSLGNIQVVFDNPGSSTVRFIMDSVTRGQKLTGNISAVKTNKEVVNYVSEHPNTIGVIGVNWISDRDDSTCLSFLKKIKVIGLTRDDLPNADNTYKPYQAYIAQGLYPLVRNLYAINTEPRQGLASGFAAFVASDRGQRIILKSGILPANAPVRIIQVREDI